MEPSTQIDSEHYSAHLSSVNNVQDVLATEDIQNEQGQLIVPAGNSLDTKAAAQVVKFKLLKPIETSVAIDGQLDAEALYQAIRVIFLNDKELRELWFMHNDDDELQKLCAGLSRYPLLLQKLTVLKLQLPQVFNQAAFCAWLSQRLFIEEPETARFELFVATLFHDIGLLHLDPALLDKEHRQNATQWRQWQSHPLIAQQIILSCKELSVNCANAVAQHHESPDATGFPRGLISKQICRQAQIIEVLDEVWHYYIDIFQPKERSLNDLIPLLQMNQNYRNNDDAEALILIFKSMPASELCFTPPAFIEPLIDFLQAKFHYIEQFLIITGELNKIVGFKHGEKSLLGMQNMLIHIHVTLVRSGVMNAGYIRWIEQVKQEKLAHAYKEVEDVSLMLSVICNYCEQFMHALGRFVEEEYEHKQQEAMQDIHKKLEKLERPEANEMLTEQILEVS